MSLPQAGYVPPANPLRTKRNFKALALPPDIDDGSGDPVPTRPAPVAAPGGPAKRRPPPLGDDGPGGGRPGPGGLSLGGPPLNGNGPGPKFLPRLPSDNVGVDSPATGRRSAMLDRLAKLDLGKKDGGLVPRLDLKKDDLKKLADLGQGNGGSVEKVEHIPTGTIMAKKIVLIDAKSSVRKQILRELQIMHECQSEYIISCYGSFLAEPNICICMEFADKGSFDHICRKNGPIDINVVCLVAHSVLEGLCYLYDVHRIIHRDIKPSNILLNSEGQIKLCDFGVSGELINSIANTFVGTSIYMSPERIQGAEYSVKSDIWSLGISLIELSTARFPFCDDLSDDEDDLSDLDSDDDFASRLASNDAENDDESATKTPTHRDSFMFNRAQKKKMDKRKSRRKSKGGLDLLTTAARDKDPTGADALSSMSIIELMHQIVREPAPRLAGPGIDEEATEFVDACLAKNPDERHGPKTLLEYRWMDDARDSTFDLKAWTQTF